MDAVTDYKIISFRKSTIKRYLFWSLIALGGLSVGSVLPTRHGGGAPLKGEPIYIQILAFNIGLSLILVGLLFMEFTSSKGTLTIAENGDITIIKGKKTTAYKFEEMQNYMLIPHYHNHIDNLFMVKFGYGKKKEIIFFVIPASEM